MSSRPTPRNGNATQPPPSSETPVQRAITRAEKFTRVYYALFDDMRKRLDLGGMYSPTPAILWNGNAFPAGQLQVYAEFLQQLPPSRHDIHTMDCQPLERSGNGILVTVGGAVTYEAPESRPTTRMFSHQFVLVEAMDPARPDMIYIDSDCFRFV